MSNSRLLEQVGLLRRQLIWRFGPLPEAVEGRLAAMSEDDLLVAGERILDAKNIEQVLGGLRPRTSPGEEGAPSDRGEAPIRTSPGDEEAPRSGGETPTRTKDPYRHLKAYPVGELRKYPNWHEDRRLAEASEAGGTSPASKPGRVLADEELLYVRADYVVVDAPFKENARVVFDDVTEPWIRFVEDVLRFDLSEAENFWLWMDESESE